MEANTVRVSGSFTPTYLKGRSTELITDVFRPTQDDAGVPQLALASSPPASSSFLVDLQSHGRRAGEGVPFAALYMARGKKKLAALRAA